MRTAKRNSSFVSLGRNLVFMPSKSSKPATNSTFAFLGPVGTFTELALAQVKESKNAKKIAVNHVAEAIELVISGKAKRAIIPVENSIEGGVSATLDALAGTDKIRIYGCLLYTSPSPRDRG
mgnify:CR=1 FL=1